MIKKIGKHEVEIDPDGDYILYDEEVDGTEILDYSFEYLPETHQLVLAKLLLRTNLIPWTFHPSVNDSLLTEKDNSIYYKKQPYDQGVLYNRTSTKDITQIKENNLLKTKCDMSHHLMRNKKSGVLNRLVDLGYNRAFVMDFVNDLIKPENMGTGLFALKPVRITEIVDQKLSVKK